MTEQGTFHRLITDTIVYATNNEPDLTDTQNMWDQPIFENIYSTWLRASIPKEQLSLADALTKYFNSPQFRRITTPPSSESWKHIIQGNDPKNIFRHLLYGIAKSVPHYWWNQNGNDWMMRPYFAPESDSVKILLREFVHASYGQQTSTSLVPYNIFHAMSTKTYPPGTLDVFNSKPVDNDELGAKLALSLVRILDTQLPWGIRYICGNVATYFPVQISDAPRRALDWGGNRNHDVTLTHPIRTYAGWYKEQFIDGPARRQRLNELEAKFIALDAAGLQTSLSRRVGGSVANWWEQRNQIVGPYEK